MLVLEVFLGARSIGRVWWDDGWMTLRIDEPEGRAAFLRRLGGPLSRQDSSDEVRFRPEGMTPGAFEEACAAVAAERGLRLAPRPSP